MEFIERIDPGASVQVRAIGDIHLELPGRTISFGRGERAKVSPFYAALLHWMGAADLVDAADQHRLDEAVRNRMESVRQRSSGFTPT
ncbi:MAG: hypothetical protein QM750_00130 [Rubrivivax sp.]